jgi:hypothetical protein
MIAAKMQMSSAKLAAARATPKMAAPRMSRAKTVRVSAVASTEKSGVAKVNADTCSLLFGSSVGQLAPWQTKQLPHTARTLPVASRQLQRPHSCGPFSLLSSQLCFESLGAVSEPQVSLHAAACHCLAAHKQFLSPSPLTPRPASILRTHH